MLLGMVAFGVSAEATSCGGEDCGGISCALPVVVGLAPEVIPADARPRLCVDDVCTDQVIETMPSHFGWGDRWSADDDVDVRLELVDSAGVIVAAFEGSGTLRGGCCKTLTLGIADDGEALIEARP